MGYVQALCFLKAFCVLVFLFKNTLWFLVGTFDIISDFKMIEGDGR